MEYRAPYRCNHKLDNSDRKQSIHQQAGPYAFLIDDEDHYDCKYECNCFNGVSYYVCYKRSFFRGRAYGSHIECKVHEREQYGACHCNDGYRRLDVVRAEEEGSRVESAGEQHGECADAVCLAEEGDVELAVEQRVLFDSDERRESYGRKHACRAEYEHDQLHEAGALLIAERLDDEHEQHAAECDADNAVVPVEAGSVRLCGKVQHHFDHGIHEQHYGCRDLNNISARVRGLFFGVGGYHGDKHYNAYRSNKRIHHDSESGKVECLGRSGEYDGICACECVTQLGRIEAESRAERIGKHHEEQVPAVEQGQEQAQQEAYERQAVGNQGEILFALFVVTHNKISVSDYLSGSNPPQNGGAKGTCSFTAIYVLF